MATLIPPSTLQVLEITLDTVKMRANINREVFGGEIMDAIREAGVALGNDSLEVLLIGTVLVRAMESLGERLSG
jgi:hypothetical protein